MSRLGLSGIFINPVTGRTPEMADGQICTVSVVEPEPDFLAGAGAGEKAPAPSCCCLV